MGGPPGKEQFLVYRAGKGEKNRLTVTNRSVIVFDDPGAAIHRKPKDLGGCRTGGKHRHHVVCNVFGRTPVLVYLGDRNDTIRFKGGNAGKLGKRPRTEVKDAARLRDQYNDPEGGNYGFAIIHGGQGDDVIRGTDSFDVIDPGSGRDFVDAGQHPDVIVNRVDTDPDTLLGGTGIDTVEAKGDQSTTIDLTAGTVEWPSAPADTLDSFERARGGSGNDVLRGTSGADGLFGDKGADTVDGGAGNDYVSGDLQAPQYVEFGRGGVDTLIGGPGDDILDGRDPPGGPKTPTDDLQCGDGADRIVARQDDLADPSCEASVWGVFSGDLYHRQIVDFDQRTPVTPVAHGPDGATYALRCPLFPGVDAADCQGTLSLERPPVTGDEKMAELYGRASFRIASGRTGQVEVAYTAAGKAALAMPGARASVHVLAGYAAGKNVHGAVANFGWQQVLGPG